MSTHLAATTPADATEADGAIARPPLVTGGLGFASLTDLVCGVNERRTPSWWWPAFLASFAVLGVCFAMVAYLISTGVGVWGLNRPVGWAFDITNFVFWVGIGHAGTLISAILLLFRQKWRTAVNRFAEAMTIFAVCCAGLFPAIHIGRVWVFWFLFPAPNANWIFPNFRSALLWDVAAVSTYATVSLLFWYTGLIPDLATLRDRAQTRTRQVLYGFFALGFRGSARHWRHYEMACLLLAGLATPLVVSVHTVVSFDFATSVIPGWHTTILPPYFVAGAVFSGFAMVVTLMIPCRELFKLKDVVTDHHMEVICKILMATGLMVGYAYMVEFFTAWYSGSEYERFTFINRAFGPYWWAYWTMVSCNVLSPQVFWFRWFRRNPWAMFVISIFVNIGMWFERFVIIVTSLHRDYLPSSWGMFYPTWVDLLQLVGSFGLFFTLFLLFLRYLPIIALSEVKGLLPAADPHAHPSHLGDGEHPSYLERRDAQLKEAEA
jgi:Ni/Fe-hydrogenase subunit HybB-like protein